MIKIKDYSWALEGLAALVLVVAFVLMAIHFQDVSTLAIQLTGLGILFFTLIRIKPLIAARGEKDYLLLMFVELLADIIVGVSFLFLSGKLADHTLFSFSILAGIVLFVRGVVHFYTTSKRYELHDTIAFIVHIVFLSFGFLFIYNNNLKNTDIATVLMALAFLLIVFFGYRTYKGYNNFRIKKTNALKMQDYIGKKEEKQPVVEEPKTIEEKINPKIIEEPKDDNQPSVNVN